MNNLFTIKNFRVFDNEGATVDIKPITILTGCNSSGKSSIVKGIYLFNDFINKLKEDYKENGLINLPKYKLDFSKQPTFMLGSFDKVISKKSTDDTLTFQYRVHSHMLCEDVDVEFVFGKLDGGKEEDGYLLSFSLHTADGIEIFLTNTQKTYLNYEFIKKGFVRYMDAMVNLSRIFNEFMNNLQNSKLTIFDPFVHIPGEVAKPLFAEWIATIEKTLNKSEGIGDLDKQLMQFSISFVEENSEAALGDIFYCFDKYEKEISGDNIDMYTSMVNMVNYVKKYNILLLIPYLNGVELSDGDTVYEMLKTKSKDAYNCELKKMKELRSETKSDDDAKAIDSIYESIVGESSLREELLDKFFNKYKESQFDTLFDFIQDIESQAFSLGHYRTRSLIQLLKDNKIKDLDNHLLDLSVLPLSLNSSQSQTLPLQDFSRCLYEIVQSTEVGQTSFDPDFTIKHFYKFANNVIKAIFVDELPDAISFVGSDVVRIKRLYTREQTDGFTRLLKEYVDEQKAHNAFRQGEKMEQWLDVPGKDGLPTPNFGDFVSLWIRAFGIGERISITSVAEGEGIQVRIYESEEDKTGRLLADFGYGITQLVAIMLSVEIYQGKTIAIEEPEIHLHPKYQSMLAAMFVDAMKTYGTHFIIETHSEYLIRKLQTLVASKQIEAKDTSLIYVYDADKEKRPLYTSQIQHIKINSDGSLDGSFGSGFFDEADNLTMSLFTQNM